MVTLRDMEEYKEFIEKKLGSITEIETVRAGIVLENFKEECFYIDEKLHYISVDN